MFSSPDQIESLLCRRSSGSLNSLTELGPPGQSFSRSLRLCEIPFPQSAASLAKTLSPRESLRSLRLCEILSLSQPLLSPRRSDRQGNFRIVAVIIILIPSLRSLRLCEILFLQSVRSLANTLRSPREFPYSRSHHHSHPLFAFFASLRDSFPQSAASLAKTLRSPRAIPYGRSHRHLCPSVSSVVPSSLRTVLVAAVLL